MLSAEVARRIFGGMLRARVFETVLADVFREMRRRAATLEGGRRAAFEPGNEHVGLEIQGNLELSIGGEATTAAILHLRETDYLASAHRGHHLALAKGVEMKQLVAEIWGRATGSSSGKGGDIHIHDVSVNFETAVVLGQLLPVAVGHGLAAVLQGRSEVAVANFGDGAANQGTFHEAVNLAGLWKLPVIFLLEDNGYALSVPKSRATSIERYAERAAGYGFPGVTVPPSEPEQVYEVMGEAVARARAGEGPTLVEVQIDRIRGGFEGDRQWYRSEEEFALMRERDAVATYQQRLIERGLFSGADVEAMTETYTNEVAEAIEFARESAFPTEAEAFTHVFADSPRVPTASEVMA